MRELLIASEYWLSLSSEPLGDEPDVAHLVPGAEAIVLAPAATDDGPGAVLHRAHGPPLAQHGVGELCLSGPMVTPGYLDVGAPGAQFVHVGGRDYLRTGDLVRIVPGGFTFVGRADLLTKDKGQWVDMIEIESKLQAVEGVAEAKILADPARPAAFHAFVALAMGIPLEPAADVCVEASNKFHIMQGFQKRTAENVPLLLKEIRAVLPRGVSLHLVQALPRHCATRKVDISELRRVLAVGQLESWPVDAAAGSPTTPPPVLRARLGDQACRQACWTTALAATALAGCALGRPCCSSARWYQRIAAAPVGLLTVAYMFLAAVHWTEGLPALSKLAQEVPAGRFGAIMLLHCLRGYSRAAHWSLIAWSVAGATLAWRRRRLLSWVVAFWAGAGHQAELECSAWLCARTWKAHVRWQLQRLWALVPAFARGAANTYHTPELVAAPRLAASAAVVPGGTATSAHCGPATWGATGEGDGNAVPLLPEAQNMNAEEFVSLCDDAMEALAMPFDSSRKVHEPVSAASDEHSSATGNVTEERTWDQDTWWWYNCTAESTSATPETWAHAAAALSSPDSGGGGARCSEASGSLGCGGGVRAGAEEPSLEAMRLMALVEQADPMLRPVSLDTSLLGMDSLRLSILASLVQAAMGVSLSGAHMRDASTPRQLLDVLRFTQAAEAQGVHKSGVVGDGHQQAPELAPTPQEFAVWWSPGQNKPMGAWVLRSDAPVDHAALLAAMQWLIDRHSALRASHADPINLMSFSYDTAVLAAAYLPLVPHCLRRRVGGCLARAWPRIVVRPRAAVYPDGLGQTPLEFIVVRDGQDGLERSLSDRRWSFARRPPFDAALFELRVPLVGTWELHGGGLVTITRSHLVTERPGPAAAAPLHYQDEAHGAGLLLGPSDAGWPPPPWGFPALFAVRFGSGGVVWLRFEQHDSLRLVYKPNAQPETPYTRHWARRQPTPVGAATDLTTVSFLMVQCFHCFADGYCYYPLVGDLMEAYHHAVAAAAPGGDSAGAADSSANLAHARLASLASRPRPAEAFSVLQGRLFDTLHGRNAVPDRHSLRGAVWGSGAAGYTHSVAVDGDAFTVLSLAATRYALPLDYLLLALAIIGIARCSREERVEMTLYVPMRDGHEASMVGLFADWRDITVAAPFEHATVLGTAVQAARASRHKAELPMTASCISPSMAIPFALNWST